MCVMWLFYAYVQQHNTFCFMLSCWIIMGNFMCVLLVGCVFKPLMFMYCYISGNYFNWWVDSIWILNYKWWSQVLVCVCYRIMVSQGCMVFYYMLICDSLNSCKGYVGRILIIFFKDCQDIYMLLEDV